MPFEDDDVVEETELVAIRLERTFDLSNRITIGVSSSGVVEITDDNDSMCFVVIYTCINIYLLAKFNNLINFLIWCFSVSSGSGGTGEDILPVFRRLNNQLCLY